MQGLKVKFDERSIADLKQNFDNLIKELENKSTININFNQDAFKNINTQIDEINKKLSQVGSKVRDNIKINVTTNADVDALNNKLNTEEKIIKEFAKNAGLSYNDELKKTILEGVNDIGKIPKVLAKLEEEALDNNNKLFKKKYIDERKRELKDFRNYFENKVYGINPMEYDKDELKQIQNNFDGLVRFKKNNASLPTMEADMGEIADQLHMPFLKEMVNQDAVKYLSDINAEYKNLKNLNIGDDERNEEIIIKRLNEDYEEMLYKLEQVKQVKKDVANTVNRTNTDKKKIVIDNTENNDILQQLNKAKAEIEAKANTVAKLDFSTNTKGKITSATISYTDEIGKMIKENYKLVKSVKETENEIIETFDFKKMGNRYTDNIEKSIKSLDSLEKQLEKIKNNNSKLDVGGNSDNFNANYAGVLNEINSLKQRGKSISLEEKQSIIDKIKLMNEENEKLLQISKNEKVREDILKEEQKIRRNINEQQQKEISNKQNQNYLLANQELDKIKKIKTDIIKLDSEDGETGKLLNQYLVEHQNNLSEILKSKVQVGELDKEDAVNAEQFLKLQNKIKENYKDIKILEAKKEDALNRTTSTTSSGRMSLGEEVKIKTPFNFNADKKELTEYAKAVAGMRAEWTKCVPKVDSMGNKMKEVTVRTREGGKYFHNFSMILDESTGKIYKVDKGLSDLQNRQLGLAEKMKVAAQSFFVWMNITNLFYQGVHKLKEGIQFTNELNKMQTNIQMITGMDRSKVQGITKDFSELAGQLHSTTKETMVGAEEFLRAGKSVEETRNLLKSATIGGKISGQETNEVSEQLIAIANGYKINVAEGQKVMDIVDKLSTVDNNASTSFRELATAMKYTSSTAQSVNVEMPNLISYIGTVSSVSRKSAESIGK